jgi:hypothetical protein
MVQWQVQIARTSSTNSQFNLEIALEKILPEKTNLNISFQMPIKNLPIFRGYRQYFQNPLMQIDGTHQV